MPETQQYLAYMNLNGAFFRSDCFELLKGIKSNTISLCFTDPPFNLGKVYEDPTFNDNISKDKYFEWCKSWISELIRVLKPGGSLCVYLLPKTAIELGYWLNQNKDVTYRSLIALKMKSVMSVPIFEESKPIGVLNIDSDLDLATSKLNEEKAYINASAYSDMIASLL
jgi:site-specific DNA-methyltransferase (adenine-specific)